MDNQCKNIDIICDYRATIAKVITSKFIYFSFQQAMHIRASDGHDLFQITKMLKLCGYFY